MHLETYEFTLYNMHIESKICVNKRRLVSLNFLASNDQTGQDAFLSVCFSM